MRLVPCFAEATYGFSHMTEVTTSGTGMPIHRANLARGELQLVVVPDESRVAIDGEAWSVTLVARDRLCAFGPPD